MNTRTRINDSEPARTARCVIDTPPVDDIVPQPRREIYEADSWRTNAESVPFFPLNVGPRCYIMLRCFTELLVGERRKILVGRSRRRVDLWKPSARKDPKKRFDADDAGARPTIRRKISALRITVLRKRIFRVPWTEIDEVDACFADEFFETRSVWRHVKWERNRFVWNTAITEKYSRRRQCAPVATNNQISRLRLVLIAEDNGEA